MATVLLMDLQSNQEYRGKVTETFQRGRSAVIQLLGNDFPKKFQITQVRGWLISDTLQTMYIFDKDGHKFKIRVV